MKWIRIVLIHRSSSFLYCYCNIVIYPFSLHFTSHPLHRWSDPTFQFLDIFCWNQRSILQSVKESCNCLDPHTNQILKVLIRLMYIAQGKSTHFDLNIYQIIREKEKTWEWFNVILSWCCRSRWIEGSTNSIYKEWFLKIRKEFFIIRFKAILYLIKNDSNGNLSINHDFS